MSLLLRSSVACLAYVSVCACVCECVSYPPFIFWQMYQRSADMGLGVPFNIASYALLTRLVAHVCGLQAGELVHVIGDAHVYLNHVAPLREQLKRTPRPLPKLYIDASTDSIDGFKYSDFRVEGYQPHPTIKMDMAV